MLIWFPSAADTDGKQKRDFIYVNDVCKNILHILNSDRKNKQTYNFCTEKQTSLIKVINIISNITKNKSNLKKVLTPKGFDTSLKRANFTKKSIKNPTSLTEGVKNTVNWYKINYKI